MFGRKHFVVYGIYSEGHKRALFRWYGDPVAGIAQARHEAEEFGFHYANYTAEQAPPPIGVFKTLFLIWKANRIANKNADCVLKSMIDDWDYYQSYDDGQADLRADELLQRIAAYIAKK